MQVLFKIIIWNNLQSKIGNSKYRTQRFSSHLGLGDIPGGEFGWVGVMALLIYIKHMYVTENIEKKRNNSS